MPDVRILHSKQLALNAANENEWAATVAGAVEQVIIQDAAVGRLINASGLTF